MLFSRIYCSGYGGWKPDKLWGFIAATFLGLRSRDRETLVRKLCSSGLSPCFVRVLESWLDDRVAEVVVGGQAAAPAPLRNSVYQGTVWGPPLWNLHYESARHSVNKYGFREVAYADDKNMSKAFAASTPTTAIHDDMRRCQRSLHEWGKGNAVMFDPRKE